MRWYADPARSLTMTTKVEANTRAWRSEADRIMGFWDERLIADLYACILTTEMLEEFNHRLQINNHKPWPKETFGPRFEQHAGPTCRVGVDQRARPASRCSGGL